ncbi:MAG: iron uptake system protein EfeO [Mycobacterium sp.]
MKVHIKAAVAAAAVLAAVSLTSCQAKEPEGGGDAVITVNASDDRCELSGAEGTTGANKFVITNTGSKVTEFYVYAEGDRVLGEVENISPSIERTLVVQLSQPGTYQTACKPGMIGDGIRTDYTVTGEEVQVDEGGELAEAAENYKRYVRSQVEALEPAVEAFVAAIKAGDIVSAKAQFPTTRTYYERIEPVAESFDNLDPLIDFREDMVEPDQKWTGFHRLEKDLWVDGLQPDTDAIADQLVTDVTDLKAKVDAADYEIDPLQIAGNAQGLLDEISASKITGEEDRYSHTDLWDFYANLQGSQTAVASVRPILDEKDPELGTRVDEQFQNVERLLEQYREGDGFVFYDTVTEPQRQELSRAIDALSKEVSQVQGVIAG